MEWIGGFSLALSSVLTSGILLGRGVPSGEEGESDIGMSCDAGKVLDPSGRRDEGRGGGWRGNGSLLEGSGQTLRDERGGGSLHEASPEMPPGAPPHCEASGPPHKVTARRVAPGEDTSHLGATRMPQLQKGNRKTFWNMFQGTTWCGSGSCRQPAFPPRPRRSSPPPLPSNSLVLSASMETMETGVGGRGMGPTPSSLLGPHGASQYSGQCSK